MGAGKKAVLFAVGGLGYVGLELLWRGRSHGSMFLAGGVSFLLLGGLCRARPRLPLAARGILGAGIITMVELAAGMAVNRDWSVWDYRLLPWNFMGQICLPFCLLWIPISIFAMGLYEKLDRLLPGKQDQGTDSVP